MESDGWFPRLLRTAVDWPGCCHSLPLSLLHSLPLPLPLVYRFFFLSFSTRIPSLCYLFCFLLPEPESVEASRQGMFRAAHPSKLTDPHDKQTKKPLLHRPKRFLLYSDKYLG